MAQAGRLVLDGNWEMTFTEEQESYYLNPGVKDRRWLPVQVPGEAHRDLMAHGLLEDPRIGLNSLKARWVQEQFFIYRCRFRGDVAGKGRFARLRFERLQMVARVFLNGQELGVARNAHRPHWFDATKLIREDENDLVVLLESGVYDQGDRPHRPYWTDNGSHLTRRAWLRRPQYESGWDWHANLVNVGILGSVMLERTDEFFVNQVSYLPVLEPSLRLGELRVSVDLDVVSACEVEFRLNGIREVRRLEPGRQTVKLLEPVQDPPLWQPEGRGEPRLYEASLTLHTSQTEHQETRHVGFRYVEVDQSPHPEGGNYFVLNVNGEPIFAKGANWVPPSFYSQIGAEAAEKELVEMAREANFNLLRVWGGGNYASPNLLEACDRAGVLVWHDFGFACAKYPGDDPEFYAEVEREAEWVVRERSAHPSLVVWCGNNELEWMDTDWHVADTPPIRPHGQIFEELLPQRVGRDAPHTFYWPSSPYSVGGAHPNAPETGDQHPWAETLHTPNPPDWRNYRTFTDRFPNEGGVFGCGLPVTLRETLTPRGQALLSPEWDHHDCWFALRSSKPEEGGQAYRMFRFWLGREPEEFDWETYALLSGLLQAEGLHDYIRNYRARMFDSAAAVFWMYNDSWPMTHSWSVVDSERRRKLAYYPVRRAFQPVQVFCVRQGEEIVAVGCNDTQKPVTADLLLGTFAMASHEGLAEQRAVLEPNSATPLARFKAADLGEGGAYAVLDLDDGDRWQDVLLERTFGELTLAPSPYFQFSRSGEASEIVSDSFVWGTCIDLEGKPAADNAFTLVPGLPYRLKGEVDRTKLWCANQVLGR